MCHLLIAEDEPIERMALASALHGYLGEGYTLHQAGNGRQAMELFARHPIQIAFLDIEMPVMTGIEVAQQIYAENPACCIIFLTAFDRFDYARKAISVRALEYLLKPYSDQELFAAVEMALQKTESSAPAEPAGEGIASIASLMEQFVCDHYRQDISMQDAARALNYSDPYFCKMFKQNFGQSFTAYLTEYRIGCAKELLRRPTVNIKEVGEQVGYPDPNYFGKVFRRLTGQSPSEYRMSKLLP
ncbi:MAG: response regulator [Oscillospiraceae bacterium]